MRQYKSNEKIDQQVYVPCTQCKRPTRHKIVASFGEKGSEPYDQYPDEVYKWSGEYEILQCGGCEGVSFRQTTCNSEDHEEVELLYPDRNEGRSFIRDAHLLPTDVERIYKETIAALNNKLPVITGMGIRALIETICKEKKAGGKDLSEAINNLVTIGILTKEGAEILHKIRSLGNKAAHEVKPHAPEQLALAVDVVEHLILGVYILPHHARDTFK